MRNLVYIGIALVVGLVIGYVCEPCDTKVTTTIRVDTVFVEKPIPYEIEKVRKEYVYVPTPADTVVREIVKVDSVLVEVEIERRTYGDDRFSAVVSGASIGDVHPTLENIEIYQTSEIRTIEQPIPLFRPYISTCFGKDVLGIGGGVNIKQKVSLGAKYMRIYEKDAIAGEIIYHF